MLIYLEGSWRERRDSNAAASPMLNSNSNLIGVVTRNQLVQLYQQMPFEAPVGRLSEIATEKPLVAC
jgi:hypothetical protein